MLNFATRDIIRDSLYWKFLAGKFLGSVPFIDTICDKTRALTLEISKITNINEKDDFFY